MFHIPRNTAASTNANVGGLLLATSKVKVCHWWVQDVGRLGWGRDRRVSGGEGTVDSVHRWQAVGGRERNRGQGQNTYIMLYPGPV